MAAQSNVSAIAAPDYVNAKLGPRARRVTRNGYAHQRAVSAIIRCRNELSFSIRVGPDWSCWPKSNKGPWERVEVADLNRTLLDLRPYRDEEVSPFTAGAPFYLDVPVALLNRIIARNGGLRDVAPGPAKCGTCFGRGWRWLRQPGTCKGQRQVDCAACGGSGYEHPPVAAGKAHG